MVRGKAYLSDVQKREKRRSKTRVSSFFGPPSTFEPVLDPERGRLKERRTGSS